MSGLARFDRVLAIVSWVVAGLAVLMLLIGPEVVAEDKPAPAASAGESAGNDADTASADGEAVFADSCGGCHTLSAAGTSGVTGPNLDGAALDAEVITAIVTEGSGAMPSFSSSLDQAEIAAVAEFVASASQD